MEMVYDQQLLRELDDCQRNACPALHTSHYDDWVLRLSGGVNRRANMVICSRSGQLPPAEKIAYCEAWYRKVGTRTIFQIAPWTQPSDLDAVLAERGYGVENEADVYYAPITAILATGADTQGVVLLDRDAWLDVFAQLTGESPEAHFHHAGIIHRILPAICPVAVYDDGEPVALALGVCERSLVGIFSVFTSPEHRRQGHARRLLSAMTQWAAGLGAQGAYLQVLAGNHVAKTLYARSGFQPCYRYWYRVQ